MPTHRDASPLDPVGAFGRMRVAVDSRIHESSETGPVLKAGPIAAFAKKEREEMKEKGKMIRLGEGIVADVGKKM